MDWGSVYDDTAEEQGNWDQKLEQLRYDKSYRTGILSTLQSGKYTPLIAYCFCVNYILGVGCLGVPFAFYKAGLVLGIMVVVFCSAVSFCTVLWVAKCSTLLMQIKIQEKGSPFSQSPILHKAPPKSQQSATSETQGLLLKAITTSSSLNDLYAAVTLAATENSSSSQQPAGNARSRDKWMSSRRNSYEMARRARNEVVAEPEVTAICEHFLGNFYAHFVYQGSLMALAYIGLLAYAQVFTQGIVSFFLPGNIEGTEGTNETAGLLTLAFFSCVVVPLSLYDLNEQVILQVLMSLLRFVSLGILLLGTLVAIWMDPARAYSDPSSNASAAAPAAPGSLLAEIPLFQLSGFGLIFTTSVFSQLFQHSVPGLIRPLAYHQRNEVPKIFGYALLTTASLYITTACAAVIYFRDNTRESVNLNFAGFGFGVGADSLWRPVASICGAVVVLFPALDTISVFPLIANTLGSNLHASFPWALEPMLACFIRPQQQTPTQTQTQTQTQAQAHAQSQAQAQAARRLATSCFRLVASLPPIILSRFVTDLTVSLQLAGVAGIVVALVTPALLEIAAERHIASCNVGGAGGMAALPTQSYRVAGVTDLPALPWVVLGLSAVAFALCIMQFQAAS